MASFLLASLFMDRKYKCRVCRAKKLRHLAALCWLTAEYIARSLLQMFEALVLSKLEWRVICVMPQDFLRHILKKLPVEAIGIKSDMVINHAKTLIALCAIGELSFFFRYLAPILHLNLSRKAGNV